ncbi:uncharacterized protein HD556DRAFT_1305489 [Suillus plorans]|uniref:Uncharacterized protein n=1 Tax=Suillus plorans TaxID=116603 RepID=A0A9P7J184_9AGAM|nr:uncharacterized protein HD556DRAFT_1305489 [Suillus plorans]KAG1799243.1 hypothetical protein HD556DRAFT_1305489 [Suillus plorans]
MRCKSVSLHYIPMSYSYALSTLLLSLTPNHCLKAVNFAMPMAKTKRMAKKSHGGLAPCVNLRGGASTAPGTEEMEVCPEFQHNEYCIVCRDGSIEEHQLFLCNGHILQ